MRLPPRLHAEQLETRDTPSAVPLTADEQYALELINRARLDPAGEAARYGIDLNEGLPAGTLSAAPRQPLAADAALLAAAEGHNRDMADRGYFGHTSPEGATPWDRAAAAGYGGFAGAENLATDYAQGAEQGAATVRSLHKMIFVDNGVAGRGHRKNLLGADYREVGPAVTPGATEDDGYTHVHAGELYGSSTTPYLTGVAYRDEVLADKFYTPGEGLAGVVVTATSDGGATSSTTTQESGGYQLRLPAGNYTVTAAVPGSTAFTVSRVTIGDQNVKLDVNPPDQPAPVEVAPVHDVSRTVVAAGSGSSPVVKLLDGAGAVTGEFTPYEGSFAGGVRVATADVNGDGYDDVVVAPGPGRPPTVKVYDRVAGTVIAEFEAFESSFTGGVFVAAADVDGDGKADVVVTPDEGGGPRVRVMRGGDLAPAADFFGIDDPGFRGGARAALGDLDGDGTPDLVVAAGFQGGPRVAAFNGATVLTGKPQKLFNDFFAFEHGLRNGTYVTVADLTGDGRAELVAGAGPGGAPRLVAFDGSALLGDRQEKVADFYSGDSEGRGGVRLATERDADGNVSLVTGSGSGTGRVAAYRAGAVRGGTAPAAAYTIDVFSVGRNGVFVG